MWNFGDDKADRRTYNQIIYDIRQFRFGEGDVTITPLLAVATPNEVIQETRRQ